MKTLAFNFLIALSALSCCVPLTATAALAQEEVVVVAAAPSWVKVAPGGEQFTVMMPRVPFPVAERGQSGALNAAGRRYGLRHDDAEYTVWSFKTEAANLPAPGDEREAYLDRCAEIAWNLMIEPHWQRLEREAPGELMKYNLAYDGALPASGHPGRRYRLNLSERQGMTHIYVAGSRIYVVAAAAPAHESAGVEAFIKSFALSLPVPETPAPVPTAAAADVGPGRADGNGSSPGAVGEAKETDYNRNFVVKEVTQRAQIFSKPEPSYTEWARKFSVTGTVRVRAILGASGTVSGVSVITRLPHGLTRQAVEAARKIKFEPAVKDGRPVSQYVTIEYNFNIY